MDDGGALVRDRLLAALDEYQDEDEHTGNQRLSATGSCLRQQYYKLTGAPARRRDPTDVSEMNDGHVHAPDIARWLERAGYALTRPAPYQYPVSGGEDEEEVYLPFPGGTAVGHLDGRISGPGIYVPAVAEFKAMSAMSYVGFARDGVQKYHPQYWLQAQGYMASTETLLTVLVAKAKDSSAVRRMMRKGDDFHPKWHVELVEYDPAGVKTVQGRHARLKRHRDAGVPPDREYPKTDWHCSPRWCPYSADCWRTA